MKDTEWLKETYPTISDEFLKICEEQYELFAQKCRRYGVDNITVGTKLETDEEIKLSLTGIWFRVQDKMNRLKQMVLLDAPDTEDESLADTFRDNVNYNIIAQIVCKGKFK